MTDAVIQFNQIVYSVLVCIPRLFVVLSLLPFLTEAVMPTMLKRALSVVLSMAIFPLVYQTADFGEAEVVLVIFLLLKEAIVGLLIAFLISIPFWALAAAGFLVDLQRGAFSATLFTPFFRGVVSPTGILLIQGAATLLFTTGGFLVLLEIVYSSFLLIPADSFFNPAILEPEFFIAESARVFFLTFIFAAPMVILMFCVDFTLGIANRFVPELNVFFISLPVKSVLAMLFLAIYVPFMFGLFGEEFQLSVAAIKGLLGK